MLTVGGAGVSLDLPSTRRGRLRLGRLAVYIGLLSAAGLAAYRRSRRLALPRLSGVERLSALNDSVEIVRDRWGVPHIYASNQHDLFFVEGYVHAQDRLWQMEYQRRLGAGRLAEVVGPLALEADRFMRRLGLSRVADREVALLDEDGRLALEAYAQGVNAYAQAPGRRLGLEFALLRWRPEPWQPIDSILWSKVIAWGLGTNWDAELLRAQMVERLGPEIMALLEPSRAVEQYCLLPSSAGCATGAERLLVEYERVREMLGLALPGTGSNNWVVSGERTASGKPLLANDPHLPPYLPGIWYRIHLSSPDLEASGASLPGAPGVVIGHNRRVAWGVTNACVDVQDLYLERRHPFDPTLYQYRNEWEKAQVFREVIKVRGRRAPVIEEVHVTRHGPVLGSFAEMAGQTLSLRWSGLEPGCLVSAALAINRAGDWESFCDALSRWTDPAQNFVYADVDGNIGYYLAGRVPVRSSGTGLVPSPGWSGDHEWLGYVPFPDLPHLYNPGTRFVVTANQQIVDDSYPHRIAAEWLNGYRAQRIAELLQSHSRLTVEDCCEIQGDVFSLPGIQLARHLRQLPVDGALEAAAQRHLEAWDGHLRPESVGAAVYEASLVHLQRKVFGPALGPLLRDYLGVGRLAVVPTNSFLSRSTPLLLAKLESDDRDWLRRVLSAGAERKPTSVENEAARATWEEVLREAFRDAVADLRRRLGDNPERWTWGRLHRIEFSHLLGRLPLLDRLLSRGPFPFGGDADTVCNGAYLPADGYGPVVGAASYRQVIDLADFDRSLASCAPGQSGQLGSPYYDDAIVDWLSARPHPSPFTRQSVLAAASNVLRLEKAPEVGWSNAGEG